METSELTEMIFKRKMTSQNQANECQQFIFNQTDQESTRQEFTVNSPFLRPFNSVSFTYENENRS